MSPSASQTQPQSSLLKLQTEPNTPIKSNLTATIAKDYSHNRQETEKAGLFKSIWPFGLLLMGLLGNTCIGIFYFSIQIECQLLKSSWRVLIITIAMFPLAILEYRKQKNSFQYSRENLTNWKSWKTMIQASLGHATWTIGAVISINYTSVAQSLLFLNLHSVMIVIYSLIKATPVSRFEILGTIFATCGTVFLAFDGEVSSKEGMVDLSQVSMFDRLVFGDLVGLLGSAGAVFYYKKNAELEYDFPLFLGMVVMLGMGTVELSLASVILEGATFSFNPMNGVFGLFSGEWFVIYICIAIITGYGAYLADIMAIKYFDALLVSITTTLEPAVGALIVFLLGWQSFPGLLTIFGFFFIIPGIIAVTIGKARRSKQVEEIDKKIQIPLLEISTS